jgi:Mg2+ and Co2+ transporter CorA
MKISELPEEIKAVALFRQKEEKDTYYEKTTDKLCDAFSWYATIEGNNYWDKLHNAETETKEIENTKVIKSKKETKHYDNTNGSIYKFCEDQELNSYEFDLIKRIVRCRKKGNFLEDLEKTKFLIDLYIIETKP